MTPDVRRALADLLEHADACARLVARGKDAYDADEMLRFAAEGLLIRLGETVRRIDRADGHFVARHADLELRDMKDARNVTAHGYDVVDHEIVWEILAEHVPRVAGKVRQASSEA